jgi:hypothetical protein
MVLRWAPAEIGVDTSHLYDIDSFDLNLIIGISHASKRPDLDNL